MAAVHPRTLIRRAVVAALQKSPGVTAICGNRIFPNRIDPWEADELPAMGVYLVSETPLDTDKSPDPDERRLDLSCEVLAKVNDDLEDLLEAVCLALERFLNLNVIGAELGGHDTLLQLEYTGFELGLASEGKRMVGVGTVSFDLDYAMPKDLPELAEFRVAGTAWDLTGSDRRVIDAKDRSLMPGWHTFYLGDDDPVTPQDGTRQEPDPSGTTGRQARTVLPRANGDGCKAEPDSQRPPDSGQSDIIKEDSNE